MSFNPLMALITQGLMTTLDLEPRVLEFGNQSFTVDNKTIKTLLERWQKDQSSKTWLADIRKLSLSERRPLVEQFYRHLGAKGYMAIDVNDDYGSVVMDLNVVLREAYGFTDTFDLVTNNGTGEHVFDQGAIYRNAHNATNPGGVMIHVMPFVNYINHGFFSFHPNFYYALACANHYEVIALGVATRDGEGVIAGETNLNLANFLLNGRTTTVETLLADAKIRRPGVRRWLDLARSATAGHNPKFEFGRIIDQLIRHRRKILSFAILRKTNEREFIVPIQGRYADVVQTQELQEKYPVKESIE